MAIRSANGLNPSKKNYTLEELGTIVGPIARAHNVTSVSLFGSRATGKHNSKSDYDFLIETNEEFTFGDYCDFIEELEAILDTSVDVVNRSTLNDDRFSRSVKREEIRVW